MSKTIVDMPKVTQMLDAGWHIRIFKGAMGSYEVRARHANLKMHTILLGALMSRAREDHILLPDMTLQETMKECHFDEDENVMTDDFTPEQALTRMAYKVHGEII